MHPAPPATAPPATTLPVESLRFHQWYPGLEQSIHDVRDHLRLILEGAGVPAEPLDDVLTCASELAGNCVRHAARGPQRAEFLVVIRIRRTKPHWLRLDVYDSSTKEPPLPPRSFSEVSFDAVGGRGLPLVAALCRDRVGCTLVTGPPRGKFVWCEIPLQPEEYLSA